MLDIEKYKPELEGVLPKDEFVPLTRTDKTIPAQLLKTFSNIPHDASGDILGKIYEYFLGNFALAEGQGGGEFFTPTSVVRLMVEIIEPYKGTVYDPACGSGGMFVQSQLFVERHRDELEALGKLHDEDQLYVYGQEKTLDTVKLAKMNLAVNGLRGEVKQANSYAEDPYNGFVNSILLWPIRRLMSMMYQLPR
jgi:type I restriction enzyme M protein